MHYLYYDSGTTNTRLYFFKDQKLIDTFSQNIGSKDSAISGNSQILLSALKEMMNVMCKKHNMRPKEIDQIWMSGMISSSTGIVEVPHLCVPITLNILQKNIFTYYEDIYFKQALHIIPGIKTASSQVVSLQNFHQQNNMRGEETEIFGLLNDLPSAYDNCIMIMPGSHTQIARIEHSAITDIISTITGELYSALKNNTILSSSLSDIRTNIVDSKFLCKGYENLKSLGFNRALYTVRTMQLFMQTTPIQRYSYFEGILNGGVLNIIFKTYPRNTINNIVVYGSEEMIQIFQILFNNYFPECTFTGISSSQTIPYSAKGFLNIMSCKMS